jgi:hypothetical protein
MVSFTIKEQEKLYELGLNKDCDLEFAHNSIDLSCYKSDENYYHILYNGYDIDVDNFDELIKKIRKIMKKSISISELQNYWLAKYHNTNVNEVLLKHPEETKTSKWYDLYPVTQEQHDEWEAWAKEYIRKRTKLSKKLIEHDWCWIHLDASPNIIKDYE